MTVTLTFCDKCGAVIPDGTVPFKMVLVDKQFDLCSECYKNLTGEMQSAGQPVEEPAPVPVQAPPPAWPPVAIPTIFPAGGQAPHPGYPTGQTDGSWYPQPTITWTNNKFIGDATSGIQYAVDDAASAIGNAIASQNAVFFANKA